MTSPAEPRYVDRPPRIRPKLPEGEVVIPPPPKIERQIPVWQALVPVVTILGYVIVSATGRGGNIAFILPMAAAVVISTSITIYNGVEAWQRRKEKREAYALRLVRLRRDMVAHHDQQRAYYRYNYPYARDVLDITNERFNNRGGTRLWERRPGDEDFGSIRLGIGVMQSTITYALQQQSENDEDPQMHDAERLETDARYVTDIAIVISLYQRMEKMAGNAKHLPRTTVGIAGDPAHVRQFANAILSHAVAFHSPNDMHLYMLGKKSEQRQWQWLYNLPHCIVDPNRGRTRVYFEDMERFFAGASGIVEDVHVAPGDVVKPGTHLASIRKSDGKLHRVTSYHTGRVDFVSVSEEDTVRRDTLIARTQLFDLTRQQADAEKQRPSDDTRQDDEPIQAWQFGKARDRQIAGVPRFWKDTLFHELDRRSRLRRERSEEKEAGDVSLPFMLIVVNLLSEPQRSRSNHSTRADEPSPAASWLDELESEAAVSLLMTQAQALGAAIIFLTHDRAKIPSGCQTVIEVRPERANRLTFLYAETGVNQPQYVGVADTITSMDNLKTFSAELGAKQVRRSHGADIPRSVDLLSLYKADSISRLRIENNWQENQQAARADWPKIPIGMLNGQEPRDLYFWADADGVHAMIAGATGSGKSELLMALILSLAIKYDPSVVNFVLIDYKGGSAFEPFRNLPHVVDNVNNLRGNAVARMFAAINAELNRRQAINKSNDVKDIVAYRKKDLHTKRKGSDNYPHLFIIIDEFAEMIANNPEYRAQLDSITRLGRALGVSLILAAQRPSGVTDQMRANIKMKICLRVETKEESSELLRLPDAHYLPSIPGRGYLQIGSESLELIQVGYTGNKYMASDYDPDARYIGRPIIWDEDIQNEETEVLFEVLVREMDQIVQRREKKGAPRTWGKPWPNPLPPYLALDAPDGIEKGYLYKNSEDESAAPRYYIYDMLLEGDPLVLAPPVYQWQHGGRTDWDHDLNWRDHAMRAVVGLVDDPQQAQLRLLMVNLARGQHAVFGASGYGKSTLLRTTLTALVSLHAPDTLHLYILDFGNRALSVFADLPHTGAYIVSHETERVERFLRMIDQVIQTRKEHLSAANTENLLRYNDLHPDDPLPAVLVVIDNIAGFRDSYDSRFDVLLSQVREGLANGVYFIIAGEQLSAFGKLYNLLPERLVLRMSDEADYTSIVGKGTPPLDEIPGRGYQRIDRAALEFQVAMPIDARGDDDQIKETEALNTYLDKMRTAGASYPRPQQIQQLEEYVTLFSLIGPEAQPDSAPHPALVLGKADEDLAMRAITLDQKPHLIVTGPPTSGKTTLLQTIIVGLAARYTPQQAAMVLLDYNGDLVEYGSERYQLHDLPHVLDFVRTTDDFNQLVDHLIYEYDEGMAPPERNLYVIIDNYSLIQRMAGDNNAGLQRINRLGELARSYGKRGLHFILCDMNKSLSGSRDDLIGLVTAMRFGVAMSSDAAGSAPFYANVPRSYQNLDLPRGRGFLTRPGKLELVQFAVPYEEETTKIQDLDQQLERIIARHPQPVEWLPLPEPDTDDTASVNGADPAPSAHRSPAEPEPVTLDDTQRGRLLQAMADQFKLPNPQDVWQTFAMPVGDDQRLLLNAETMLGKETVQALLTGQPNGANVDHADEETSSDDRD